MLRLGNLKDVYVSSARRGFLAVAERPSCVDRCDGSSGNDVIVGIKRVAWAEDGWRYADPQAAPQFWLRSAWDEAVSLKGDEPWRVYRLSAAEVAARLAAGESVDDVRGFRNRLEPWQPIAVDPAGDRTGTVPPSETSTWERLDGWRATRTACGLWIADGSRCDADDAILEHDPAHFDGLPGEWPTSGDAIRAIDLQRPWE